jgi:hypothetical protein
MDFRIQQEIPFDISPSYNHQVSFFVVYVNKDSFLIALFGLFWILLNWDFIVFIKDLTRMMQS